MNGSTVKESIDEELTVQRKINLYEEKNERIEHILKGAITNYASQNPKENIVVPDNEPEGSGFYVAIVCSTPKLNQMKEIHDFVEEFKTNEKIIEDLKLNVIRNNIKNESNYEEDDFDEDEDDEEN